MWKREKSAFQQQVGELQAQLAASVRSNRVLVQHLAEIGPMAGGLLATPSSLTLDASANASAPTQALRRRRVAELASADERRKVEIRAAREVAARSVRAEQRHVAALQR